MKRIMFWQGIVTIEPSRVIVCNDPDCQHTKREGVHTSRQRAAYREAVDGMRRYLGHDGAQRITYSMFMSPGRCEITIAVPRMSDNHDADCERAERFVNAVFFGDQTEGFDAAPTPTNDPPPQSERPAPLGVF